MLRSMQELEGCAIRATDGIIGHVKNFYFDDEKWAVRYFVVETGTLLSSRKVLISPIAIGKPDWTTRVLPVSITKEQVRKSPDIDMDKPVSRQHEMQYLEYYGYPNYWDGGGLWASVAYPGAMLTGAANDGSVAPHPEEGDPHLRSCNELMKYDLHATDGHIGHVDGLLIDEDTWAIRYLVVATSSWWHGQRVLIAPQWIQEVPWSSSSVIVALSRQSVREAPPYDAATPPSTEYELALHTHHGRVPVGAHHT